MSSACCTLKPKRKIWMILYFPVHIPMGKNSPSAISHLRDLCLFLSLNEGQKARWPRSFLALILFMPIVTSEANHDMLQRHLPRRSALAQPGIDLCQGNRQHQDEAHEACNTAKPWIRIPPSDHQGRPRSVTLTCA